MNLCLYFKNWIELNVWFLKPEMEKILLFCNIVFNNKHQNGVLLLKFLVEKEIMKLYCKILFCLNYLIVNL